MAQVGPWRKQRTVPVNGRARPRPDMGNLDWEAAIGLFIECWAADHPGIRQRTLKYYRDQLASRLAAFSRERKIRGPGEFSRYDLRAFVSWLDEVVTRTGRPLTPRGKQMALNTAKRFLSWLYQEGLLAEDIASQVGSYRLDFDPEPRATPHADLEKVLSILDPKRHTGLRNTAIIYLLAFGSSACGDQQGTPHAVRGPAIDHCRGEGGGEAGGGGNPAVLPAAAGPHVSAPGGGRCAVCHHRAESVRQQGKQVEAPSRRGGGGAAQAGCGAHHSEAAGGQGRRGPDAVYPTPVAPLLRAHLGKGGGADNRADASPGPPHSAHDCPLLNITRGIALPGAR